VSKVAKCDLKELTSCSVSRNAKSILIEVHAMKRLTAATSILTATAQQDQNAESDGYAGRFVHGNSPEAISSPDALWVLKRPTRKQEFVRGRALRKQLTAIG
jgi:hypothetical protein